VSAKIYTVRFEHPYVGNKGGCVYVSVRANSKEDAVAVAKTNVDFMSFVKRYENKEYPIIDEYFSAFVDAKGKVDSVRNYDGDERL
jgi:hypothetical protein